MEAKLKQGDIIQVNGWVMLQKMEGRLRVAKVDSYSYWFTKVKGQKIVVRHYINSVDSWIVGNSDNNNIQIIKP